jgi:translation initiation factor 3 subunit D
MPSGESVFTYVKAVNEYEPGANGALDWRKKLDTQRGAVVAMEMKNNNYKLSRWAVQAYLSGAEQFKLG